MCWVRCELLEQDALAEVKQTITGVQTEIKTLSVSLSTVPADERNLVQQQLADLQKQLVPLRQTQAFLQQQGAPPLICVHTPTPSLCIQPLSAPLCAPRLLLRPAAGTLALISGNGCARTAPQAGLSCPPRSHTPGACTLACTALGLVC